MKKWTALIQALLGFFFLLNSATDIQLGFAVVLITMATWNYANIALEERFLYKADDKKGK